MTQATRIGVLAVQGNFREHAAMLRLLGVEPVEVRKPEQLDGLEEPVARFEGPIFGTCAGMILFDRNHLGLLDLEVARNAYGRQVASFEADIELAGEDEPIRGVFIRAPRIAGLGPAVEVLGRLGDDPVLVRQGRVLAASFHPELTADTRVHARFVEMVREVSVVRA